LLLQHFLFEKLLIASNVEVGVRVGVFVLQTFSDLN
jgi:hypothetical protein